MAPNFWRTRRTSPFPVRSQPKTSLFRYLFPKLGQRTRSRFDDFRYGHFPLFRSRTKSRIYRYLLARKARRDNYPGFFARLRHRVVQRSQPGILGRLSARGRGFWLRRLGKDEALTADAKMTSSGGWGGYGSDSGEREPGTRRRKLAGYLKAANELRQTYQQNVQDSWASRDGSQDMPGSFPDANVATGTGKQEMLIFPSYARRHVKHKVCLEDQDIAHDH